VRKSRFSEGDHYLSRSPSTQRTLTSNCYRLPRVSGGRRDPANPVERNAQDFLELNCLKSKLAITITVDFRRSAETL
jgi:hypothetical protein